MNYLEISSFIEAKKKHKAYIEQELRDIKTITSHFKKEKPVKWYNSFYYILKRAIFLILSIFCLTIFISSFTNKDLYRDYFSNHFSSLISSGLNKTFGTHHSVTISETSAVDAVKIEEVISKPVRMDIQNNISSKAFDYLLCAGRILFLMAVFLFWYIARLTRKLHLKNQIISDYYNSNLSIMDIYREVIEEQNFEIDFLTKTSENLYSR